MQVLNFQSFPAGRYSTILKNPSGRECFFLESEVHHFIGVKTEAQRVHLPCPRSHSKAAADSGFLNPKVIIYSTGVTKRPCHPWLTASPQRQKAALSPHNQVSQCFLSQTLGRTLGVQRGMRSGPSSQGGYKWGRDGRGVRETCPHSFRNIILPHSFFPPLSVKGPAEQTDVNNIWATVVRQ